MTSSKALIFALLLWAAPAFAVWPPTGSPLANGDHPRLWLISQAHRDANPSAPGMTVTELRAKVAANYSSDLQSLVTEMSTRYGEANPTQKLYLSNDLLNYALLSVIDPASIGGYTDTKTAAEYATRAKSLWDDLVANVTAEANDAGTLTAWLDTRYLYAEDATQGGIVNMSIACAYDWLGGVAGAYFDAADVTAALAAMDNAYTKSATYLSDKKPYLGNTASGAMHNGYYIALALHGDVVDADLASRVAELEAEWYQGVKGLGNEVFAGGSGNQEGTAIYTWETMAHLIPAMAGFSSAINEDLFATANVFSGYPELTYWQVLPFIPTGSGKHGWVHAKDDDPDQTADSEAIARTFWQLPALLKPANPNAAGLMKWLRETSGWLSTIVDPPNTRTGVATFRLLTGTAHITAVTPASYGLGLSAHTGDQVTMRSHLTNDTSTHITLWVPTVAMFMGGHNHYDTGSFLINKFGNLATQRSINKAFSGGNIVASKYNLFYNTVAVQRIGETTTGALNLAAYRNTGWDQTAYLPDDTSWDVDGANYVGTVLGKDLNGSAYDYVDYHVRAWSPAKVDYHEREFVYLRSEGGTDDEYVIVYDRINAVQSADTKYWLLQTVEEPVLLDSIGDAVAWTSYTDGGWSDGGRSRNANIGGNYVVKAETSFGVTHGRMFARMLEPTSFTLNKVGGTDHWLEDTLGASVYTGAMTSTENYYRGSHALWFETAGTAFDKFLSVLQFGDTATLSTPVVSERITATGGNGSMVGALVKDGTKNRVALFNASKSASVDKVTGPISYTITTTAASRHLLTNVQASTAYTVTRAGVQIATPTSTSAGTLTFEAAGVGAAEYILTAGAVVPRKAVRVGGPLRINGYPLTVQ
jgi:hypothetical protein